MNGQTLFDFLGMYYQEKIDSIMDPRIGDLFHRKRIRYPGGRIEISYYGIFGSTNVNGIASFDECGSLVDSYMQSGDARSRDLSGLYALSGREGFIMVPALNMASVQMDLVEFFDLFSGIRLNPRAGELLSNEQSDQTAIRVAELYFGMGLPASGVKVNPKVGFSAAVESAMMTNAMAELSEVIPGVEKWKVVKR